MERQGRLPYLVYLLFSRLGSEFLLSDYEINKKVMIALKPAHLSLLYCVVKH